MNAQITHSGTGNRGQQPATTDSQVRELKDVLHQAVSLAKQGKLDDDQLARIDATVSVYLGQQIHDLRASGILPGGAQPARGWPARHARWLLPAGALLGLVLGYLYYPLPV